MLPFFFALLVGLVAQANGVHISGNIWLAFGIVAGIKSVILTSEATKASVKKEARRGK